MDLVARHLEWMHVRQMKESKLRRFLRREWFAEHLELHRLDCASSNRRRENYDFAVERLAALPAEALRPPALVNGDDLIELRHDLTLSKNKRDEEEEKIGHVIQVQGSLLQ